MTIVLRHQNAEVHIEAGQNGLRRIEVHPFDKSLFVSKDKCETSYPLDLIQHILNVKGPDYLCDEIMRDEDPAYVRKDLEADLNAYFDKNIFAGKRLLDFGCGSGASSMILARMFPTTEIVGVELDKDLLSVARARAEF